MDKKKSDESASGKHSSKEPRKKHRFLSALLADMEQGSSSRARTVPKRKASSYTDGSDLPPCDEQDEGTCDEEQRKPKREQRHLLDISVTDKEQKRRALKDDHDASTVVIGSKTSVLEGDDTADEYKEELQREIRAEVDE